MNATVRWPLLQQRQAVRPAYRCCIVTLYARSGNGPILSTCHGSMIAVPSHDLQLGSSGRRACRAGSGSKRSTAKECHPKTPKSCRRHPMFSSRESHTISEPDHDAVSDSYTLDPRVITDLPNTDNTSHARVQRLSAHRNTSV